MIYLHIAKPQVFNDILEHICGTLIDSTKDRVYSVLSDNKAEYLDTIKRNNAKSCNTHLVVRSLEKFSDRLILYTTDVPAAYDYSNVADVVYAYDKSEHGVSCYELKVRQLEKMSAAKHATAKREEQPKGCKKDECPLPRIGSKDWGWSYDQQTERYKSKCSDYWIEFALCNADGDDGDLFDVATYLGCKPCCVGSTMLLSDAKRFAEMLTRRNWRWKNRGKR